MQTVSDAFSTRTSAAMRKITARLLMSFRKDYDATVDFFTVGISTIGGTDVLKGDGSVVQEWDKYTYEDFSDRIISIEINREVEPPTSPITQATCDIVLDNHDDIFTIGNSNSPLDGFLLPRRPVRVNAGFSGETIPKFVGLTDGKPEIDEKSKTAKFHCIDFLSAIMNISLDEEVMYQDYLTNELVQALLETAGLTTTQFDLDDGGIIIPFAYFKKGTKIGEALKDIAEAELGNIYMSESGVIKFENRQNWNSKTPVYIFDKDNLIQRQTLAVDTVINVVEVYSKARAVQTKQTIYQGNAPIVFSDGSITIKPGETKTIFANFRDEFGDMPVTTVDDPEPYTTATTSVYRANSLPDGDGDDLTGDIDLDSTDLFSTTFKMTFTNNGTRNALLTQLELFGTPARVISNIYKRVQDTASIGNRDAYEEHPIKIDNDLIQDETAANTIGQLIIQDRGEDDDQQKWIAKSVPQLQVGDAVTYEDENTDEDYFVTRVNDIINTSGYRQVLRVSKRTINTYFRIGISTIGGSDPLGP